MAPCREALNSGGGEDDSLLEQASVSPASVSRSVRRMIRLIRSGRCRINYRCPIGAYCKYRRRLGGTHEAKVPAEPGSYDRA